MEENGSWSANLKTMSRFCYIFPSILILSLSKTEGSMSSKPDKLYTIFLPPDDFQERTKRKEVWLTRNSASRQMWEGQKWEQHHLSRDRHQHHSFVIITLMIIINFIVNFIAVFVDFFQLKILPSSHGPSCEWSRCLQEVFPVATHWWFRQTRTAGSEDHVFCVCFADFFLWCWQISSHQDQISQEHILCVNISSNSSGSIAFERCSDNFDKSAWVWFHQKDGCHLSSENIPNVCDMWHLQKCVVFVQAV